MNRLAVSIGFSVMTVLGCGSGSSSSRSASDTKDSIRVEGAVQDQDGVPVSGAVVAAVVRGASWDAMSLLTRTDERGHFAFDLQAGVYGFTATAPGHPAGFRCGVAVERDTTSVSIKLAKPVSEHPVKGTVRGPTGTAEAGATVRVYRFSNDECDVFYAQADSGGSFSVSIPKGEGAVVSVVGDRQSVMHQASEGDAPLDLVAYPAPVEGPAPAPVVEWVRKQAIHLRRPDAERGLDDMERLRAVVGDARVVSLGEATHGTREFFQLKHRMLEFLVTELGFTAFVIEATMPEAFDINEYVLTGKGAPKKALASLYFWVWNTEEVLALIEWMRRYNANPANARKVRFYGNDIQYAPKAADVAIRYLRKHLSAEVGTLDADLEVLSNEFLASNFRSLGAAQQGQARAAADKALAAFDRIAPSRRDDAWRLARQHARILVQFVAMNWGASDKDQVIRDRAMADNSMWALENEGPSGKIVIWQHNLHAVRTPGTGIMRVGEILDKRLGPGLRTFGFAFNEGGFQATDAKPGNNRLRTFEVGPASSGSIDRMLSRAGGLFVLDLRSIPASGPVAQWFRSLQSTRMTGSAFSDDWEDSRTLRHFRSDYDAIFFVKKTTAARPLHPRSDVDDTYLDRAGNLGLEDVGIDGRPTGWRTGRWLESRGFQVLSDSKDVAEGKRAFGIGRDGQRRYGKLPGELTQRIAAKPFAGSSVRFRFRAKMTGAAPVYVYAKVDGARRDGIWYARVDTTSWTDYEVLAAIPADAAKGLQFGLSVTGKSTGWIDGVSITAEKQ